MTADHSTQHKEFSQLAEAYLKAWAKADAEKREMGKISHKTRKLLESIAEKLNA